MAKLYSFEPPVSTFTELINQPDFATSVRAVATLAEKGKHTAFGVINESRAATPSLAITDITYDILGTETPGSTPRLNSLTELESPGNRRLVAVVLGHPQERDGTTLFPPLADLLRFREGGDLAPNTILCRATSAQDLGGTVLSLGGTTLTALWQPGGRNLPPNIADLLSATDYDSASTPRQAELLGLAGFVIGRLLFKGDQVLTAGTNPIFPTPRRA